MKRVLTVVGSLLAASMLAASCSITMPVTATSNPVGSKVGMATGSVYFGVFAFGADASIRTAAKNGANSVGGTG